jgi:hypothetical protein
LNFSDIADNEFWVEAERCTGPGCTNFTKVAQSRGEDTTGLTDTTAARGVTYTYRVRARGFMGLSGPSNTIVISVPGLNLPAAPSNLTAAMSGADVVLNWIIRPMKVYLLSSAAREQAAPVSHGWMRDQPT